MSLYIQSGTARGRRLRATPRGLEVRPILGRMKKSLFDIIRPKLKGARFLDLYAGTGAVGLEALSNGAAHATFVDAQKNSLRMIERNIADTGFAARSTVIRADATGSLRSVGPADIVFMGPPYKDQEKNPLSLVLPTLAAVARAQIVGPHGWVIAQHHKKEPVTPLLDGWELFRQKVYGDTLISFFRPVSIDGGKADPPSPTRG